MRLTARDTTKQILKNGAAVLVGWHGIAECDVAEVLQRVIEFKVTIVSLLPHTVTFGEFLRAERRQS